ncbi:hypothetical protein DICVIV_03577 [Dictyocaulus viviparus]|uniref:RRM domain-containing protein n=1 Tax=Dictyocaulus viviparus TaxID=29172 RepID=A0A0D8Y2Q7_DICVI|nr:hypothetical protein DICVIV_03577 [Dictyocaulus viviparus]
MRSLTTDREDRKNATTHRSLNDPGRLEPCLPSTSQHQFRCYKTLYDKDLGAKETIRRYNGHIPGHPKYDVKMPLSDPRNQYIQYRAIQQADLCVPSFTVDRNTIFYPKVEVALFDLNDNVNNAFLQQLAVKVAFPVDLEVFYHPITKKHMGMAMIVFTTFDVTLLSQRYEDATGEEMRIPLHLKNLEEGILNTRRSQLAMKIVSQQIRSSSLTQCAPEKCQEEDMDMESSSGSIVDPQEFFVRRHEPCNTDFDGRSSIRTIVYIIISVQVRRLIHLPGTHVFTVCVDIYGSLTGI